ncbi:hypothetical protein V8C35DRAFT_288392 [Trichoderma chlorosporum]
MPLINGQKMACEPCIRGHRSTKCTHASDRLMVPVRKPGRPLSSCPHPSSQVCGCAAVTAAFPKKQKCRCGTSEKASGRKAGDQESQETLNGLVTPPNPSPKGFATKPAFRVQKAASKAASGKKPIDPASLERIDASQLNIVSSPESNSPQSPNSSIPMIPTGHGMMGFVPSGNSFIPGPAIFPSYQQAASANPIANHNASELSASSGHPPHINNAPPAAGSCCGTGKSTVAQPDGQQTPVPTVEPVIKSEPGSCCSSGAEKPEIKPHEHMPNQVNGMMMQQFNVPLGMPNAMYPYMVQPSIFAYPPQYGSYLNPLQPDQYKQLVTLNFPQQMTDIQPAPYNAATPAQQFAQPTGLEADSWTSHHCGCGDSCQCIGCATHPYNQATQDYVRSAWNLMVDDMHKRHRHSDSAQSIPNANYEAATSANQSPTGASTPVMATVEGTVSPILAQTPSEANSTLGEETALSANDFFFVSYPFGDSCEGETASCPCGDDCRCIGCAIHNGSSANDFENVELGL